MKDCSLVTYSASMSRDFVSNGGFSYINGRDLSHITGFRKPKTHDPSFFIDVNEHIQELIKIANENKKIESEEKIERHCKTKRKSKKVKFCCVCEKRFQSSYREKKTCSEECKKLSFKFGKGKS